MSPVAFCKGVETVSSVMELRPLGRIMSPALAAHSPLEVVFSPVIGCFLGAMACWRGFLRRDLVEGKSEHLDSDLNDSTKNVEVNSLKGFIYTQTVIGL